MHKIYLVEKYITCQTFFWYWLFTKLNCTKTTTTTLRLCTFSPFFVLSIFCSPNIFMVPGVRNSNLYPSFVLNTYLLLILLMQIWIWALVGNVSSFFYDEPNIILNIRHWIKTIRQFELTLELSFWVYCFCTVALDFSTCNK